MDFEEILKEAFVGILVLDGDGTITGMNSVAADLLGVSGGITKKTNILNLDFVVNSELYEVFQSTLLTGKTVEADTIYTSRDGEELYISVKTLPKIGRDGKVLGLTGIIEDVTEKAKLSLRFKKLAELTDTSADAIVGLGLFRGIESWNKGAEDIFGYTKSEIIGRKFDEIFAEKTNVEILWKKVLKWGNIRNFDTYQKDKKGNLIPVNITASVIKDGQGNIIGVSAVIKDVTEKVEAQKSLEEYAKKLEHSNKLKDLFTDIMRHDLLNPVGIIRNLAEMVADEEKFKDSKDINMIWSNARKLEEMIVAASSYATLDSVEDIDWVELDLNAIIMDAAESLKPLFDGKHISLEHLQNGEYPAITFPLVEEVFVNLLSNAVKYSPENTKVTVNIEDMGEDWRITVADNGIGVPDEYKETIFNRFTRRFKEGVKGSGIGLTIVTRVAELHDGKTGVIDNPGGGCIFYFEIPKSREAKT